MLPTHAATPSKQTGVVLNGLRPYQRLFATLRFFRQLMIYDVSTSIRISYDGSRQQVRVSWNFVLHMRAARRPLHVDGISIYSLNTRGKVRKHVVEVIVVNGEPAKPPFAEAWINLPSWLGNGLKRGTAVPGLSSTRGFTSRSVEDLGPYMANSWKTHPLTAWKAPIPSLGESGSDTSWVDLHPLYAEAKQALGDGGRSEGFGDVSGRALLAEHGGWAPDMPDKVEQVPEEKGIKRAIKKKGFWPITDIPGGCETSWDCERDKVCCDLVLVKMCCTGGVMHPKADDLIPVLTPVPGRGRTDLDL